MVTSLKVGILEKLCRTCMEDHETEVTPNAKKQKAKSLISIYRQHVIENTGNLNIMDLLKQTSPQLTVENNDMLPKNICESCLDMLVNIYEFQQKSLRVEERLRDIIKGYYTTREIDTDPLNINKLEQAECEDVLKIEIDEPLTGVSIPIRSFFTLTEKDGQIIKVYNNLEKSEGHTSGCSDKCDTDDDVGGKWKHQFDATASEASNNGNPTDATVWKYIDGNNQDTISVMEEQNSKYEGVVNGEENSYMHRSQRKRKRLDKRTRTLRKSNRDKINNRKQKSDDERVEGEQAHQPTIAISIDIKNVTEAISIESAVSDCNETSVEDNGVRELPSDISESFKSKIVKNDTELGDNQQNNLNLKDDDEKLVCVKANTRAFSCNECGKRLKTRRALERHLEIHLKNKLKNGHICPECGMRLKTRATFKRHLLRHDKDGKNIKKCAYLCSICGKSYPSPYSLNLHSELHGTELKYQCPECPKRFRCRSNMTTHKAIVHSTVRPHVCDVCGSSFKKPYGLTKHKINHGEKKHKCDYCELKFSHPFQCRRHMRTHTGEKPYKCRYCERSYSQSTEVMKHLRVHLGDNVYRCEMCPKAFRLLGELRSHFTSHKDDDEETTSNNLRALKEEEKRIQAKIESGKATEHQS